MLTLSHAQDIRLDLKRFSQYCVTLTVVLKQFQMNLFHMLRSLARILWGTGVRLDGKGCFFPFNYKFSN